MGEKARVTMLQAGIRNPKAPIYYLVARTLIPFLLVTIAWIVLASSEREISRGVVFMVLVGMAGAGFFLPRLLIKNHIIKRQQEIGLTFPDALDMMLICVQGGIGLEQTIDRIADEISEHAPTLAEELGILSAEMGMLNDRRGALREFAKRVGSGAARSFATALIQAEQYGTSVSNAMRVIADELREARMAAAEQKAASLPPKLTVPMILFFLPPCLSSFWCLPFWLPKTPDSRPSHKKACRKSYIPLYYCHNNKKRICVMTLTTDEKLAAAREIAQKYG